MNDMTTLELLFRAANGLAMSGWIALALAPATGRWQLALQRYAGRAVPLLLALVYGVLVARPWGSGGFGSLAQVQALFASPALLLAGWLHYLAFDLFVGSWIAERARRLRLPHALVLPLLLLTFMLGPLGLLAYALLRRTAWRGRTGAPVALPDHPVHS